MSYFFNFFSFTHIAIKTLIKVSQDQVKTTRLALNVQSFFQLEISGFVPFLDVVLTFLDPDPYSHTDTD